MYILTIDVNGMVGQEKIDRLTRIHETPQDPVIVEYTEQSLPDGYTIAVFDGLVEHYVKGQLKSNPKYLEHNDGVKKALHQQKERLSKEKFFNQ
jgi:hypothetical protein